MRILCAYSGVDFNVEHFPAFLTSREAYHPIFNLPQKKLISYLRKWSAQELTPTDSYLLFLAVLKSTDLVDFRLPAIRSERTDSIIAQNMERLMNIVIRINTVSNPGTCFPHFVISAETRNLDNIKYWIQNWNDSYDDFQSGRANDYDTRKLVQREAALERMIKNPYKPEQETAYGISEWAAAAGEFPVFETINRFNERKMPLADYWKQIIVHAANPEKVFSINRQDLEELIEHCETNIDYGSIFSSALYKILRKALEKQKNFLGLGDLNFGRPSYMILSSTDNVEDANIRVMIDSAPLIEPSRASFENTPAGKFAYMKAKMQFDMAKKHNIRNPE